MAQITSQSHNVILIKSPVVFKTTAIRHPSAPQSPAFRAVPRSSAHGPAMCHRACQCAVKGESTQPVRVRSEEVSVRLGSYPGDGEGDRTIEAPGTKARPQGGSP